MVCEKPEETAEALEDETPCGNGQKGDRIQRTAYKGILSSPPVGQSTSEMTQLENRSQTPAPQNCCQNVRQPLRFESLFHGKD
jgi:hypothetical protein